MNAGFSDRQRLILLREFIEDAFHRLDRKEIDTTLSMMSEISAVEDIELVRLVGLKAVRGIVLGFAPRLFLHFLETHADLLDSGCFEEWVRSHEQDYPEERLKKLLG
jgi:hypothetical protein